jgi:hypothetical protein
VGCNNPLTYKAQPKTAALFHAQLDGYMTADYWFPNALASISVYPSRSGAVTSTV